MNMHIIFPSVGTTITSLPDPDTWDQSLIVEKKLDCNNLFHLCTVVIEFENKIWRPYITNYTTDTRLHNPYNPLSAILFHIMQTTSGYGERKDAYIIANKIRWYTITHILRYGTISLKAFSNIVSRELSKAGYNPPKKVAKSKFYNRRRASNII